MPEPLLGLLKLCALALLYLFFFRVLRAVWAEVNPRLVTAGTEPRAARSPRGERPAPRRARGTSRLVVAEPRDRKGQGWELGQELTVGRAAGCQIRFDDSYVSQLHARVFLRDGVHHVEDLGSTNGTILNGKKVTTAVPLRRGDKLKVGSTVLEVA